MDLTVTSIKWKLRVLMADRKKSVTNLAQHVGVSRATASAWVNSDEVPTFRNASETLLKICEFVSCDVSELIVQED